MRHLIIEEDLNTVTAENLPWERLTNKRILITGANGFLPAYLVETLLYLNEIKNLNIKILALVRNRKKAYQRFIHYNNRNDLEFVIQDVTQPIAAQKNINFIIHAAAQPSPKYFGTDPVGTLSANVLGTYHLLELARNHPVESFLFISSGEVYGQVKESEIPTPEYTYGYIDPTEVRSCYSESKRMGETMCVSWHHQYGVPAKIVRPAHTYGPGMKLDDGRVYADFVKNIINNENLVLNSDGKAVRAFCYLTDAILGFLYVLFNGESAQAYNIGNPKCAISILQLAKLLINLFPEKQLQVIMKNAVETTGYLKSNISQNCPDITKASKLGWSPQISLEAGFTRTIRSFL